MIDSLRDVLEARMRAALEAAGAPPGTTAAVQPSARPEFGDYQANGVMGAAKKLGEKPRDLAARVLEHARIDDLVAKAEIAGPGFINLTLTAGTLGDWTAELGAHALDPRPRTGPRVVVDYSSPNLAKEMHVGHLRSTIIGDAVARTLEHTGHQVIRQNHVGDWGTQFGMLLAFMDSLREESDGDALAQELGDLEAFYRRAKARFDADPAFADRARETVVRLQSGDPECRKRWHEFIDVSLQHCEALYRRLGTTLTRDDVHAESAYNDDLAQVVADLDAKGLLTESDGAQCVFLDEFRGKDDAPLPLIVQKSDGGYLYATTDLAAVRYRHGVLHADRALYFVDNRQSLHFRHVFAVARAAAFTDDSLSLEHMPFGTMLGEDGRPFRTRAGDVVKLADLLDEAEERAYALVSEKNPELDETERREIARVVGIGAVKYADLSKHRTSDYVFSWDAMLSLDGNTAPYQQYAYSRVRSLFRRAEVDGDGFDAPIRLEEPAERALALTLVRMPEILNAVVATGQPHLLCTWLFDLTSAFMTFYEQCQVLNAEADTRASRLALARRVGDALRTGLG
ncbi:MAG TPA: arginine--tRNA ligase, partial [Pseudomonadales bacterium]|nr:arginine--tRNA ligase [Pseudomonadales bacterium]